MFFSSRLASYWSDRSAYQMSAWKPRRQILFYLRTSVWFFPEMRPSFQPRIPLMFEESHFKSTHILTAARYQGRLLITQHQPGSFIILPVSFLTPTRILRFLLSPRNLENSFCNRRAFKFSRRSASFLGHLVPRGR